MKKGLRMGFVLTAALMLATCGLSACTNGGGTDDHEHTYQWTQATPATCELAGSDIGTCTVCGEKTSRDVPALGHKWGEATQITPADCVTDGLSQVTCSRCDKKDEEVIPALGHDFANYEVVTAPTFDGPGLKKATCSRCDATDEQIIPRLDENTPIEYTFRVVRTNGNAVSASTSKMKIAVYTAGGSGSPITEGNPVGGVLTVKLLPQTYTVKVSGTPDGYSAKASYSVTAADPICDIVLTAAPIQGTMPSNTIYRVGSLMYDFTITTIKGETLTLSEILKTKKGVLLNFWATWCGPCEGEFPAIENLYNEFKNDVAVIAIDQDTDETKAQIESYVASHGLTFPIASDTLGLYSRFNRQGIPVNVFIDAEGFVTDISEGVETDENGNLSVELQEAKLRVYFEKLAGKSASAKLTSLEAILPEDDED